MSSSGPDISELSESQRSALETYTTVTGQEPVEAIALLGRSQWNVQVGNSRGKKMYMNAFANLDRLPSRNFLMAKDQILLKKLARRSKTPALPVQPDKRRTCCTRI